MSWIQNPLVRDEQLALTPDVWGDGDLVEPRTYTMDVELEERLLRLGTSTLRDGDGPPR